MDDARTKLFNMYFERSKPKWQAYTEDLEEIIDDLLAALLHHMSNEDKLEKELEKLVGD